MFAVVADVVVFFVVFVSVVVVVVVVICYVDVVFSETIKILKLIFVI